MADRYKNAGRNIKTVAFLCFSAICVIIAIACSGVRFVYNVSYNGQKIAVIKNKGLYESAVDVVKEKVSGKNVTKELSAPEFSLSLNTLSSAEWDTEKIADRIIDNTDGFAYGVKATVKNKSYIFARENKRDVVEDYLSKYDVASAVCTSKFLDRVKVEEGIYLLSDVSKNVTLNSLLDSVDVLTVAEKTIAKPTEYKTVFVETSELVKGTQKVKCEGSNGETKITEKITYLNGKEKKRKVVSKSLVSAPIDKVVLVGTSVDAKTAQNNIAAHNLGFTFPISDSYRLGDGFGNGRNHKGYDILCPNGTPIHAALDGTVIRSSWYSGYGNCIDIDHGNGIVTRYGHASEFFCTVGQRVSAGDIIAKVGTTGNSYGYHVHFEVIINGGRVDPAPYLNIY